MFFFSLSPFLVASRMEYLYIATDRIFVSCVMEGRGAIIGIVFGFLTSVFVMESLCLRAEMLDVKRLLRQREFGACMMELIS